MNSNAQSISRFGRAIASELIARIVAREVHRFDDRTLADLGIGRSEIDALVRGSSRRRS